MRSTRLLRRAAHYRNRISHRDFPANLNTRHHPETGSGFVAALALESLELGASGTRNGDHDARRITDLQPRSLWQTVNIQPVQNKLLAHLPRLNRKPLGA